MALNIYEELDVSAGGDNVDEGFEKCKFNWASIDTELNDARGGEVSLDARLDELAARIVTGVQMWFYEDTAPTGWTINSNVSDCLASIKGGSQAYNVTGGDDTEAGSWTQDTHIHEMPSHTHTLSAHTHTWVHNHQWYDYNGGEVTAGQIQYNGTTGYAWESNGITPEPMGPNEDFYTKNDDGAATSVPSVADTSSVDPGDAEASKTAITWRPYASVGIVATRD